MHTRLGSPKNTNPYMSFFIPEDQSSLSRVLASAEMEVRSTSDGRLVATGSGTSAVTSVSRQARN